MVLNIKLVQIELNKEYLVEATQNIFLKGF